MTHWLYYPSSTSRLQSCSECCSLYYTYTSSLQSGWWRAAPGQDTRHRHGPWPPRPSQHHTQRSWNGECVRDRALCRQNGQYLLWWILVLRPDLLNISLMDTICRVIYCQDLPCRLSEIILTLFHHTTSRGNISSIVFNQLTNFSRQFPTLPQFLASQNTKWPFLGMKNHLEIRLQCGKVMKLRINKLSVSWEAGRALYFTLHSESGDGSQRLFVSFSRHSSVYGLLCLILQLIKWSDS